MGFPVVILNLGYRYGFLKLRSAYLGNHPDINAALGWWALVAGIFFAFFVITSTALLFFLRKINKPVPGFLKLTCVLNVFILWGTLCLSTITEDPIALTALSPIGLNHLHTVLYVCGLLWWLPTFYILFSSVDLSRSDQA